MPDPNPSALEFLLTRRSRPAKTLRAPVPSREELAPILTAGLRSPDHGKLEPWRLVVMEKPALERLSGLAADRGAALGLEAEKVEKLRGQFANADLAVAVICSPKSSEKVPEWEQHLSAGAVCLSLVNAALASGWGANWLTGVVCGDAAFLVEAFDAKPGEFVAGFIHIGTESATPPERPRPNMDEVVTWLSA